MHGARQYETSRRDEMVQDPRRDAETFWAETETKPETHSSETETLTILSQTTPRRRDQDHIPDSGHRKIITRQLG